VHVSPEQEELVNQFLRAKCRCQAGVRTRGGDLWNAFVAWCRDGDRSPVTEPRFWWVLKAQFGKSGSWYCGIELA